MLIYCCFAFCKGRGGDSSFMGKIWCNERLDEMLVLNKAKISSSTSGVWILPDNTEVGNQVLNSCFPTGCCFQIWAKKYIYFFFFRILSLVVSLQEMCWSPWQMSMIPCSQMTTRRWWNGRGRKGSGSVSWRGKRRLRREKSKAFV